MTGLDWDSEWLETDGLGGFSSGTVSGRRTRRYHALLLAATTPPAGRMVLVNGFDAWIETATGRYAISSQDYSPDVVHPDGQGRIESFVAEPWPRCIYRLDDGTRVRHEIFVPHGSPAACVRWTLVSDSAQATLIVRPFFSGRDYHSLHHENGAFRFDPESASNSPSILRWKPYDGVPTIIVAASGTYRHEPLWYRNFSYSQELARGLDDREDLASPGSFQFDLATQPAVWIVEADTPHDRRAIVDGENPLDTCERLAGAERSRRSKFTTPLQRGADAYLVRRGRGTTIVAGYPWFTDWGRDTFVALRGLCLATGRLDAARNILLDWSRHVSQGMLPNRFPDHGEQWAHSLRLGFASAVGHLRPNLRPGSDLSSRSRTTCRLPGWDTFPKSPMPSRRTHRAVVPSRPGAWASCCAWSTSY